MRYDTRSQSKGKIFEKWCIFIVPQDALQGGILCCCRSIDASNGSRIKRDESKAVFAQMRAFSFARDAVLGEYGIYN
mgnify:CR=1 FL=1